MLAARLFYRNQHHTGVRQKRLLDAVSKAESNKPKQLNDGLSQRHTTVLCSRFPNIRRDNSQGAISRTQFRPFILFPPANDGSKANLSSTLN